MKRCLSMLLAAVLLCMLFPVGEARAEGYATDSYPVEGGEIYYNANTGTIVGASEGVTKVELPDFIAGTIVREVAAHAFFNCTSLVEVILPNGVVTIGKSAFAGCENLKKIKLPENLKTLEYAVFSGCISLESVTMYDKVSEMGSCVFAGCTSLRELTFSAGLTEIPSLTCENCVALEKIVIPEKVLTVRDSAFIGCTAAAEIYLPDSVTTIEERAFMNNTSVKTLRLSRNLEQVEEEAFRNLTSLESLTLPNTEAHFGKYCFAKCGIRELTIPPEPVLSFYAFAMCYNLESVVIEEGRKDVSNYCFAGSVKLKDVSLPNSLTWIGEGAFKATAIETLVIPPNVGIIDRYAFLDTERLLSVGFLGNKPQIRLRAFSLFIEGLPEYPEDPKYPDNENLQFYYIPGTQGWKEGEALPWDGVTLPVNYPDSYCIPGFTDVRMKEWYASAVEFVVENGLMQGTDEGIFEPETVMSRAMLVTVLWRAEGEPAEGSNIFTDVPEDTWYTDAVAWAAEIGVVNGVGRDRFAPDGNVTREQLATILYRYSQQQGIDVSARADLQAFPDGAQVSAYAVEALSWAVAEGLVNGSREGDGIWLEPQSSATRAQVAAILMRYIQNIAD